MEEMQNNNNPYKTSTWGENSYLQTISGLQSMKIEKLILPPGKK